MEDGAEVQALKAQLAEERKTVAVVQAKYEGLCVSLQERVNAENQARMQRAVLELEKQARSESERSRQAFDAQQAAEQALALKFKALVADLRQSWQEEEVARTHTLELSLKERYSAVLEHMEAQLVMALQIRDAAEDRWSRDFAERNAQQVSNVRAFEEKCQQLYNGRIVEHEARTDEQMAKYHDELLALGERIALERKGVEARLRRVKLACQRWKVLFQKECHAKYREATSRLEDMYLAEITALLDQVASLQRGSAGGELVPIPTGTHQFLPRLAPSEMRMRLQRSSQAAGYSIQDQCQLLASLLDCSSSNALLQETFDGIIAHTTRRAEMGQMQTRREAIEARIRLLKAGGASSSQLTELTQESARLKHTVDAFQDAYVDAPFTSLSSTTTKRTTGRGDPGQSSPVPSSLKLSAFPTKR